jgi:hypothetical protein
MAHGSKPNKTPADADTNKQARANSGKRRPSELNLSIPYPKKSYFCGKGVIFSIYRFLNFSFSQ